MFLSASVGLCALAAIIRAFRGETQVGNFFLDMWRVVIYMLAPAALISGVLFIQQGMPMTYRSQYQVSTLEPGAIGTITEGHAKPQTIVVGPVGAVVPIKMLGTNGGGFYGTDSAHPFGKSQRIGIGKTREGRCKSRHQNQSRTAPALRNVV